MIRTRYTHYDPDVQPTLKKPALEQSMTGALSLESAYLVLQNKINIALDSVADVLCIIPTKTTMNRYSGHYLRWIQYSEHTG